MDKEVIFLHLPISLVWRDKHRTSLPTEESVALAWQEGLQLWFSKIFCTHLLIVAGKVGWKEVRHHEVVVGLDQDGAGPMSPVRRARPAICLPHAVSPLWLVLQVKAEMETLVREKGVNSFQMFMTYKDLYMLRDSELYQVLHACRDIGAIARVHAENGELVAEASL